MHPQMFDADAASAQMHSKMFDAAATNPRIPHVSHTYMRPMQSLLRRELPTAAPDNGQLQSSAGYADSQ